jgi:hypothetical protein
MSQGLNVVEVDIVRSTIQLRLLSAPDELKCRMRRTAEYLQEPEASLRHAAEGTTWTPADLKDLIRKAAMGFPVPESAPKFAYDVGQEQQVYLEWASERAPAELKERVRAEQRPHPMPSIVAVLDEDREQQVLRGLDAPDRRRCHDGVDFFNKTVDEVERIVAQGLPSSVRVSIKASASALEVAREKFPREDWDEESPVSSSDYIQALTEVFAEINAGRAALADIDTIVATVVRGRMQSNVVKSGDDTFELFEDGRWRCELKSVELSEYVGKELRNIFGKQTQLPDLSVVIGVPPRPLASDVFIERIAKCVVKYTRTARDVPKLDSNAAWKLLDCNGLLLDFAVDAQWHEDGTLSIGHGMRRARAEDRLFTCMPHAMPDWHMADEVEVQILELAHRLHEFYKTGGKTLCDTERTPHLEALRGDIRARITALQPHSVVLNTVMETLGDVDMAVFVLVLYARIVTGAPGFVEMPVFTGPPSSGKTLLCNFPIALLGGPSKKRPWWTYVESLPNNYLTVPQRADGDASKPTLNKVGGKRLVVVPECVDAPLIGDVCKMFLDDTDAGINARANHSGKRDNTTFAAPGTLLVMRQTAVKLKSGDDTGMAKKILEIRPPFDWVVQPEPESRQRQADRTLAAAVYNNEFGGEVLHWARVLAPILRLSKTRHMDPPRPAVFADLEIEALADTALGRLRRWLRGHLVKCELEEASPCSAVIKAVRQEFGGIDAHVMTAAGIGNNDRRRIRTRIGGSESTQLIYFKLWGSPVRLATADEVCELAARMD